MSTVCLFLHYFLDVVSKPQISKEQRIEICRSNCMPPQAENIADIRSVLEAKRREIEPELRKQNALPVS